MYRGSSPIFDVPEFPPLRRVKPLPKRRRTSADPHSLPDAAHFVPEMLPADGPADMTAFGLNLPLPQYYMPMFTGVQDMFRVGLAEDRSSEYPGGFAVPVGPADEEDHGDGDYVDHLQQPGNTKKRKVPAAHHATADLLASPTVMAGDDDSDDRGHSVATIGRNEAVEMTDITQGFSLPSPPLPGRKNRCSAATLAALQHKELLKSRKRQLAAVLGALSHGDTLALDQALSARYSSTTSFSRADGKENEINERQRSRWNKRRTTGWALMPPPADSEGIPFPMTGFTFACPSPTSERLISTREEVAVLHARFEAELSRQAAKAAEVARQNALAAENGTMTKRGERNQQRMRSSNASSGTNTNNGLTDGTGAGAKTRTSKKKKRSALANASNPHHLRNYVPSRIPHSGQAPGQVQASGNAQNLISPSPVRFLAAEIPPRRRKKTAATPALAPLGQPEEEWICALCEYNLFYGEDAAFRRAIRSRKKILVRRRRARERAAAAAGGHKPGVAAMEKSSGETAETTGEIEQSGVDVPVATAVRQGNSKKERDKQGA